MKQSLQIISIAEKKRKKIIKHIYKFSFDINLKEANVKARYVSMKNVERIQERKKITEV